ncbi:unnamed protein product [Protopolystoma xenopodis]|uniref:Protein kinase domain-containing protein n=1 Tax=Protopolystoma xenopodis TaxID=117903 RepID=A0A448X5U1_9PLAT|nr:unnamed protein product [Protopolystoma xenopodis]
MSIASRPINAATESSQAAAPAATNVAPWQSGSKHSHISGSHQGPGLDLKGNYLMSLVTNRHPAPRQMITLAKSAVDNQQVTIQLNFTETIGQGTFGQIERATLTFPASSSTNTGGTSSEKSAEENPKASNSTKGKSLQVAVKRVLQDPRYKNRELNMMQKLINHPNVVKFYFYYYSTCSNSRTGSRNAPGARGGAPGGSSSYSHGVDLFLHLVLECFPESLCELIFRYSRQNVNIPILTVKIFIYQMLKALAYLHSLNICHRDIKSSNLLVDEDTLVLKVCDFGSAKEMIPGTANVSYISSRWVVLLNSLFFP